MAHFRFKRWTPLCIFLTLLTVLNLQGGSNWRSGLCVRTEEDTSHKLCSRGYFSVPGMSRCHPLLNCADIKNDVVPLKKIGEGKGFVKQIELASWKEYNITLNSLSVAAGENRNVWGKYFINGMHNIKKMQPSENIVQFLGFCGSTYVTEFHPLGSADNYEHLLQSDAFLVRNNIQTRLNTCISYIEAINFLHNSPMGTRIFCDTYTLERTLRQMLLTLDLKIVLNDIEELAEVKSDDALTMCAGNLSQFYPFVAPEQRSIYLGYNEKVDIWKIPTVCEYFFGPENSTLATYLYEINKRCKSEESTLRPTAQEVLEVYREVLSIISKETLI